MFAEDERRAEETMTKSEPQGTGYMVLALQEQLMQLKVMPVMIDMGKYVLTKEHNVQGPD